MVAFTDFVFIDCIEKYDECLREEKHLRSFGSAITIEQNNRLGRLIIGIRAYENLFGVPIFIRQMERDGHTDVKIIGHNHRWAGIRKFLCTYAIMLGTIGDYAGYDDRWCYETYDKAKAALDAWDGTGEPEGWHRNPGTGRRRINGDPSTEYVHW